MSVEPGCRERSGTHMTWGTSCSSSRLTGRVHLTGCWHLCPTRYAALAPPQLLWVTSPSKCCNKTLRPIHWSCCSAHCVPPIKLLKPETFACVLVMSLCLRCMLPACFTRGQGAVHARQGAVHARQGAVHARQGLSRLLATRGSCRV